MRIQRLLGVNVRLARRKLNWSQDQLAESAGLDRTYVSGIERGTRNPTVEIVDRIAQALSMPPHMLLAPFEIVGTGPEKD